MKKNLVVVMALLTLFTFGTASSSHAFVGLTTITIVCASAFVAIVAGDQVADRLDKKKAESKLEAKVENVTPAVAISDLSPGG